MAIDFNDEILQDFLVEAGEIMELLDEQLVELESNPSDSELLNAIFRGFHTVKGGAGFLSIDALVVLCHRAEDVFNLLRQGDLQIERNLMDVILEVYDNLREMFSAITNSEEPEPAPAELINSLEAFLSSDNTDTGSEQVSAQDASPNLSDEVIVDANASVVVESIAGGEDITDDEFEALLDTLHGGAAPTAVAKSDDHASQDCIESNTVGNNEITEEEFEDLLDQLHGGALPGANVEAHGHDSKEVKYPVEAVDLQSSEEIPTAKDENPEVVDNAATADKEKNEVISESTSSPVKEKAVERKSSGKNDEKPARQQETTVRVDTGRLDDIMNLVGELVLVRNRLSTLETTFINEEMSVAVGNLDLVTSDLQTAVMKTRMQPIKKVFGRFPRVVRDLSRSLNKDVELILFGEETDLDKNLVEALADPLIHLVRNSVDHGVEMPDTREQSGKPRKGTITLSAEQQGEYILLSIEDDGAGIDPEIIRSKAVDKGLIEQEAAARLSDEECYNLILMPGFSTKEAISDISGRGVGMDVVKTKITQLNGSINIKSAKGKGSRIEIKVPLTLAIMPTLMVCISGQVYALPLASVVEIFNFDETSTKTVDGQEVLIIRNKALPIYHLNNWLSRNKRDDNPDRRIVVVNSAGKDLGFIVDALLGQEEVVIKPLGALLQGTKGISGATITGDGKISLILDVPGLMKLYANGR